MHCKNISILFSLTRVVSPPTKPDALLLGSHFYKMILKGNILLLIIKYQILIEKQIIMFKINIECISLKIDKKSLFDPSFSYDLPNCFIQVYLCNFPVNASDYRVIIA